MTKFTDGWILFENGETSKSRRVIKKWMSERRLLLMRDWVYAGRRKGKNHYKIRDPQVAMIFKLSFLDTSHCACSSKKITRL